MDFAWVGPSLPEHMSAFLREGKAFGFWDHSRGRFAPQIQVTTFADMREIAISGRGLSAALPSQLKRELAEGLCALLPVAPPWLTLNYGFITKRGRTLSPPASVLMDIVRTIERDLDVSQDGGPSWRQVAARVDLAENA